MPESWMKSLPIDVQKKLYESESPLGTIAVYETAPFGKVITIDGSIYLTENDSFFCHEMMIHPALFTHPHPKNIAIIGDSFGVLGEALKHTKVEKITCINTNADIHQVLANFFPRQQEHDPRIINHAQDLHTWLRQADASYDVIIETHSSNLDLNHISRALNSEGILVQPHSISMLELNELKPAYEKLKAAGFQTWQPLQFPQPSHPSGWRILMMATKHAAFKRVKEKDIFNRAFATRYYNYDVHHAALALPEFMKDNGE